MNELSIIDLYDKSDSKKNDKFKENIDSNLHIITDYDKVECNFEWLEMMEDTVRYLDNILRNPNRFIVNEEDIVKIELARRVTVKSIKHLSRNTNLIQDYDKKTGDVRPSKILNINKEESFNTYENRFIYSLIQNMKFYIERKKRTLILNSSLKDNKSMEYNASGKVGKEKIDIEMRINSKYNEEKSNCDENGLSVAERIEKLELQIADLCHSNVYQAIDKLHIALVVSPIKKTNVILKNVNFQYAVKLWNYMQENIDDSNRRVKKNNDYYDNGELKKCMDESFLLDYLVMDSINSSKNDAVDKNEVSEKLVGNMIEKLMHYNGDIDEEKLKDIVGKQFTIIKYKTVVNEREIEKIFKKYMDRYLDNVENIKL